MTDETTLINAEQMADDVSFTEATLDDNMIRQPSLVAYYGQLVAKAQFNMDNAKQIVEIAESKEAQQMRDEAADNGTKITESQINSTLPTRSRVMKARKNYNQAKSDFEAAKVALESLRHKKDMMIQIAVGRRSEMENKINGLIKLDAQEDNAREARKAADKVNKKAA